MLNYKWPGNVRELENTLERSVLTSSDYQNIRVIFEGEAGGLGPAMSVVSDELIKLETFEAMQKHYFEAVLKAAKGRFPAPTELLLFQECIPTRFEASWTSSA